MDPLSVHKENKDSDRILRPRAVRYAGHQRPSTQTHERPDKPNGDTDVPASAPSRHDTFPGRLEDAR